MNHYALLICSKGIVVCYEQLTITQNGKKTIWRERKKPRLLYTSQPVTAADVGVTAAHAEMKLRRQIQK